MLKVLEHYVSVQGEGPNIGRLTQFVRFAGCNLRCPGWPCDTQHAIQPSLYRGKYAAKTPETVIDDIKTQARMTGATNVCFTGGEPFVQRPEELNIIVRGLTAFNHFDVEVFTNGTVVIPDPWLSFARINMDWKLEGSGEGQIGLDERMINLRRLEPSDMVKFVIKDEHDFVEACTLTQTVMKETKAQIWAGVAFGELKEAELIAEIIKHRLPWNFNVQVHKYIWPADMQGV